MSTKQITLEGDQAETGRERPETFMWCDETEQWVLKSQRHEWPHELYETKAAATEAKNETAGNDDEDEDDGPERVGSWYDVTISLSVDYRFRIPAHSEGLAKDVADRMLLDSEPSDSQVVHTRARKRGEVTTADVPNDWDPYGSERLHEVLLDD